MTDPSLHPDLKPDLGSLRVLARCWARKASGVFSSPHVPGAANLADGQPVDARSLQVAIRVCYVGGGEFKPMDVLAAGKVELAGDLWECALAAANPTALRDALDAAWVQRSSAPAAARLPLSMQTRRVLSQRNSPRLTLLDLISAADVAVGNVDRELSALVALGFFRLRRAAARGRRPPRSVPLRDRTPAGMAGDAMMLRRLQKDWELVRDADDWTVIGASPTMDRSVVDRACQRMLDRYNKAARNPQASPAARELAQKIRRRVAAAVQNIQSGSAVTQAEARLRRDPMGEGLRLAAEGSWGMAARCFAVARKVSETARNVAWLGWATYNDESKPERRKERALELLALAESMGGHASEVQLLRARADKAEGDLVRAWNRLERLVEQDPSDSEARELLGEVQMLIKRER